MTGYVFVSYSRSDANYVDQFVEHLRSRGVPVWVDHEIAHGDRWISTIRRQIDGCSAMVVVMSPEAEQSSWVQRESAHAERMGKPVLPLLLRGGPAHFLADVQHENVEGGLMPSDDFVERLKALVRPALAPLPRYPYRRELLIGLTVLLVPLALITAGLFGWAAAELAYRQHWTMADEVRYGRPEPLGSAYWETAGLTVAAALAATAFGLAAARLLSRPAVWIPVGLLALQTAAGYSARNYLANTAAMLIPVVLITIAALVPVDPTTRRRSLRQTLLLSGAALASCAAALSWLFLRIEYTGLGTQDLIRLYRIKADVPIGPLLWTIIPPVLGIGLGMLLMWRVEGLVPQIRVHRPPRSVPAWLVWRAGGTVVLAAVAAVGVSQELRRPDRYFSSPELSAVVQPWLDEIDRCFTTVCHGSLRPSGTFTLTVRTERDDASALAAMRAYLAEHRDRASVQSADDGLTFATDDRSIAVAVPNCRCWLDVSADSAASFEALWRIFDYGYRPNVDMPV